MKTHVKALLVVSREAGGVRHYLNVGTGNYHAKTARIYEDFGLFTADPELTEDVADLFNSLTGYAQAARVPQGGRLARSTRARESSTRSSKTIEAQRARTRRRGSS